MTGWCEATSKPSQPLAEVALAEELETSRVTVRVALRELAERGSAVVVTGHDVTDLLAVADNVTWMVAGTTHQLRTPEEARDHDQFVREYLESF